MVPVNRSDRGALRTQIVCAILVDMDHVASLQLAVELAQDCIEGRITPLQTGRRITGYTNPWHPAWDALNGAHGPLSAFYTAGDEADRVKFLGDEVEKWHPDVGERKRAELAEAEEKMASSVLAACRALVEYAARSNVR